MVGHGGGEAHPSAPDLGQSLGRDLEAAAVRRRRSEQPAPAVLPPRMTMSRCCSQRADRQRDQELLEQPHDADEAGRVPPRPRRRREGGRRRDASTATTLLDHFPLSHQLSAGDARARAVAMADAEELPRTGRLNKSPRRRKQLAEAPAPSPGASTSAVTDPSPWTEPTQQQIQVRVRASASSNGDARS